MKRMALAAGLAGLTMMVAADGAVKNPSALYTEIVSAYMESRWEAIDTLFKEKSHEMAGLERSEAADVATMRAALLECRPVWWWVIKQKKKVDFKPNLWGRPLTMTFDPEAKSSFTFVLGATPTFTVNWLVSDMDSLAPAEHGFSKGDLLDLTVFSTLGMADAWGNVTVTMQLDDAAKAELQRYLDFRGNVSGVTFGSPRARQWGLWLYLSAYRDKYAEMATRNSRKAVAAMFLVEILSKPETYPSIHLPKTLAAENAEEKLAMAVADWIEKHPWTLGEDNALRAAIKQFAIGNMTKPHTTGKVELPNKLLLSLEAEGDKALVGKRDAWVKQQYDKAIKKSGVSE